MQETSINMNRFFLFSYQYPSIYFLLLFLYPLPRFLSASKQSISNSFNQVIWKLIRFVNEEKPSHTIDTSITVLHMLDALNGKT